MGINPTIVDKNIGYELRSADPIPYDIEYTRNLGYGAVRYLLRGGTGAMITFEEGHLRPIPFVELLDYKTGKVKIRKVDITSENYEVGRKYMIRLEKEDFDEGRSRALAEVVKMSEEQFRERFFYVTT